MKSIGLVIIAAVALLFTACTDNENYRPQEHVEASAEEKVRLHKLVKEAKTRYEANKSTSTH